MASNTALSRTCAEPMGAVVAAAKSTTTTSANATATNTHAELDEERTCSAESACAQGAGVVGGLVGAGLVGGVQDGVSCVVGVGATGAAGSSRRLPAAAPCETGDSDNNVVVAQVAVESGSAPSAGAGAAVNVWQVAIFTVISVTEIA